MEELLKQLDLFIVALSAAIIFFLKEGTSFLFEYLKKSVLFKQDQRQSLQKVDTELKIEQLKLEAAAKRNKIKEKQKGNLLKLISQVRKRLVEIRELNNARNVIISAFHNGVAKGFRNFSRRYDIPRELKYLTLENYQVKPLAGYYDYIMQFEKQDYIIHDITGKTEEEIDSDKRLNLMEADNVKKTYVFPILIPEHTDIEEYYKELLITKGGENYYILGCLLIFLDNESDCENEDLLISTTQLKISDITNIFLENPNILG